MTKTINEQIKNYGGIILFYIFIIICVIIVNARFEQLNEVSTIQNNILAVNE